MVVRGTNEGKTITTTIIENRAELFRMAIDMHEGDLEHHQDPPVHLSEPYDMIVE